MVYGLRLIKSNEGNEKFFLREGVLGEGAIVYNPDIEGKPFSVHVATAYIGIPPGCTFANHPEYGPDTMLMVNANQADWLKLPSGGRKTGFRDFVRQISERRSGPRGIVTVTYGVPLTTRAPGGWSPIQLYHIHDYGQWRHARGFKPANLEEIQCRAWQLD